MTQSARPRNYLDLILVLTAKEIKLRYSSNVLGYLWSIANPLIFALVYTFAFKVAMKVSIENYGLFLITGLFPWQWFSNSVTMSPRVFIFNASLIKKINFPRNTLVLVMVLQDMIHFMLSIPIIWIFLISRGGMPALLSLVVIPLLLAIQFAMTYGISLALASLNPFFRDLEKIASIGAALVFFCTPIVYAPDMLPGKYQLMLTLNPLASLMICWRNILIHGRLDPYYFLVTLFYAALFLALGSLIFRKLSWKFAELL
jgi:lipopolysaccharide transport system permease protein